MPLLREVRADQLLTIRELARRAAVAPSTIYLIETGRSIPRLSIVQRLATVLGVAPQTVEEFRHAIEAAKAPNPRRRVQT